MTGDRQERRSGSSLADFGLVSLVVGGASAVLLGMVVLGLGALLGGIPVVVALLLGIAVVIALFGLVVTAVSLRRDGTHRPDQ